MKSQVLRIGATALAAIALLPTALSSSASAEGPDDDLYPPTITLQTPGGVVDGWKADPFNVTVSLSDFGGSGLAGADWALSGAEEAEGTISGNTATIPITAAGRSTLSVNAEDRAGNQASNGIQVGVDATPPRIILGPELSALYGSTVPVDAGPVVADYSCADEQSGIRSCSADIANGQAFDPRGRREIVITAHDNVGRSFQATIWWTVASEPPVAQPWTVTTGIGIRNADGGESPKVGVPITATIGISPEPDSMTFQWYRWGQPILGATNPTYVPTVEDAEQHISYAVWPVKQGYEERFFESPAWTVQPGTIVVTSDPRITGTPRVGTTLRAVPPTYSASGVHVTYEWLRGTTPIPGAIDATYVPGRADAGRPLTLRVRATAPGYEPDATLVTSKVVAKAATRLSASATAQGKGRVKVALHLTSPIAPTGVVRIYRGARQVGVARIASGRATLVLKRQQKGLKSFRVSFAGDAALTGTTTVVRTRVR